ncbi:hypothetical protein G5B47_02205 [Paenibacillus sp. 7124]|uniref:Uncharacterized protein n=1 Tax=Paenibacillus apii TaxID=1850370 RepID=A0A6M1PD87_9BACL|nr:hypothetical protein [Paenibacillus apii]NGM81220.1 hypothetical protein [Paenibacillus apii]
MRRKVSEVIAMLNVLPIDAEIDVNAVWTNGKIVRQFKGQEKYYERYNGRTSPERGFSKMTAILIPEVSADVSAS